MKNKLIIKFKHIEETYIDSRSVELMYYLYFKKKNDNKILKSVKELVTQNMKIISVREKPEYKDITIQYFQKKWANENTLMVYEDCITNCITTTKPLPHWYLLEKKGVIIGCAGLITNDFISRMDLYPWFCALYIEKEYRGNAYGSLLLDKAKNDAKREGFSHLYLCTDHIGYYEKYGFTYIGIGYHPWGDSSRIYMIKL